MKVLIIGSRGMLGQYLLKTFSNNLPLSGCLKSVIPSPALREGIPLARESLSLAKEIPPLAPASLGRDDKTVFLDSLLSERGEQMGREVIGWDKDEIDITDQTSVNKKIQDLKPDLIINSAAYNNVDACEENPDLANAINGRAPGYLAAAAKKLDIPMIHFSTGYVFDGEKGNYTEEDKPNPISKYAQSKLLGEREVKKNTDNFYIIRTNLLFGNPSIGGKKSFIELMLKLAGEKDKLEIVNDEISNPTYAKDLAYATFDLIAPPLLYNERAGVRLLYHFVNDGSASWCDWAKEIFKIKNIDIEVEPVTSSKFLRAAKRPKNSSLLNTKFPKLRPWQEALREYLLGNS